LIEERNSLLNTGLYTKDDPLILELNNKINLLQESWILQSYCHDTIRQLSADHISDRDI
jgi:hypothetical protein